VARSIVPLRKNERRAAEPAAPAGVAQPKTQRKQEAQRPQPRSASPPQPSLAPLDRRMRRRLARGTESIDARFDLHGLTQAEAHAALHRFLHSAQARGCRLVLVITGKGGSGDGSERGVLKRQVPLWLRLPEFRTMIVGFETAAIAHGGEGALYVRLRQKRSAADC
jgi:DNA-nicking Smr family endonuclease